MRNPLEITRGLGTILLLKAPHPSVLTFASDESARGSGRATTFQMAVWMGKVKPPYQCTL